MDAECFSCVGKASRRYTLRLEGSAVLEDKWLCDVCLSDFREVTWIDVQASSGPATTGNGRRKGEH